MFSNVNLQLMHFHLAANGLSFCLYVCAAGQGRRETAAAAQQQAAMAAAMEAKMTLRRC
jgi:hypothetical protein